MPWGPTLLCVFVPTRGLIPSDVLTSCKCLLTPLPSLFTYLRVRRRAAATPDTYPGVDGVLSEVEPRPVPLLRVRYPFKVPGLDSLRVETGILLIQVEEIT